MSFLLAALFTFALVAFDGYALAAVWGWHLAPAGLPPVSWATATAALLVLNLARHRMRSPQEYDAAEEASDGAKLKSVGYRLLAPALTLAFGWALTLLS